MVSVPFGPKVTTFFCAYYIKLFQENNQNQTAFAKTKSSITFFVYQVLLPNQYRRPLNSFWDPDGNEREVRVESFPNSFDKTQCPPGKIWDPLQLTCVRGFLHTNPKTTIGNNEANAARSFTESLNTCILVYLTMLLMYIM